MYHQFTKRSFIALISLLYFSISISQLSPTDKTKKPLTIDTIRSALINSDGTPSNALMNVLHLWHISQTASLNDIIQKTQVLLRKPKQERQIKNTRDMKSSQVFQLFDQLGLIQKVSPQQQQYDYVILLGCTLSTFHQRLDHLVELFQQGIRFNTIIVLAGQRQLDPKIESVSLMKNPSHAGLPLKKNWQLTKIPKTEADMVRMVFNQTELPLEITQLPIIFIDAPQTSSNLPKHPPTGNALIRWMNMHPQPGSCLVISSQPYVGYQDAVVRTYIHNDFIIDTVGRATTEKDIDKFLTTLARWVYQMKQL